MFQFIRKIVNLITSVKNFYHSFKKPNQFVSSKMYLLIFRRIMWQLFHALYHMHENSYVHRDLKVCVVSSFF